MRSYNDLNCKVIASSSLPSYATEGSAGSDLYAYIEDDIILKPLQRKLVNTGVKIALPAGFEAQIRPRSGLALNHGITVLNSPGTIDSDYRGEIGVILINLGDEKFVVKKGMKIAQMIVAQYTKVIWDKVDELPKTTRNEGGFGSTGM